MSTITCRTRCLSRQCFFKRLHSAFTPRSVVAWFELLGALMRYHVLALVHHSPFWRGGAQQRTPARRA